MGLSFDKYKEMNDKGMFYYDTSLIQHTGENLQKLLTDVNGQMRAEGTQWSDDEFKENRQKLAEYKSQLEYMQGYANSIKDSDSEAYNSLMEVYNGLSGHVGGATNWFAKNTDADKRTELYTLANQQREEQKKNIDTVSAMQAMRLGNTTAKEQAEKYGLDEKELGDTYASFRADEKQQDREVKYGSADFKTLVNTLTSKSKAQIAKDVQETLNEAKVDENQTQQQREEMVFQNVASKHNISADEVRNIYQSNKEVQGFTKYASEALSDEDKAYIVQRILETGTPEELKQLRKTLPTADYYNDLRKQINNAIEERSEEKYYVNVVDKYPNARQAINYVEQKDLKWTATLSEEEKGEYIRTYEQMKHDGVDTKKFFEYGDRRMHRLKADLFQTGVKEITKQNPAAAAVASLLSSPINMVGSPVDAVRLIGAKVDEATGGDGYFDTNTTFNKTAQNIRATANEMIANSVDNEQLRHAAQLLYSSATSMADMGVAIAANQIPVAGQFISGAMFFSSAGVAAANEVIDNGGSLDQATMTMIAQGAAELIFEEVSLDKIKALQAAGNVKGLRTLALNTLKQSGVEASEEVFTTLANTITDAIINGDNSEMNRTYQAYIKQGYSEEEAKSRAYRDWLGGLCDDALGGAISGGVFGSAISAVNMVKGKAKTNIGGMNVTESEYVALVDEKSGVATKEAEKTALEIIKKQGVKKTLEAAKNSVDDAIRETAEHFLEVNEQGKLNKKDAAALFVRAAKAQAVNDSIASLVGEQTSAEYHEVKSFTAQQYSGYDETGARIGTENRQDSGKVKTRAFGKSHPKGVSIHDAQGNAQIVTGIDSSMNEYGKQGKTVTLTLDNGETVDADSVTFDDSNLERLANLAANYDTLGARALLANWESAQQGGVSIDDYIGMFQYFYEKGGDGVTFDSALQNAQDKAHAAAIGYDAARAAIEAGMNDRDISTRTQSYFQKKVRVPGKSFAESRVSALRGVTEDLSDDTRTMLQAIADKTGKDIVLTKELDDTTYGQFKDNEILINAKKAEHAMFTTALHEATHNAKVYDPEGYRALEKFITNYLTAQGMDVQRRLDELAVSYQELAENRAALREELVCKTVEALAADEKAFQKAIASKENRGILKKLGEFLHRIAEAVKNYFKGDRANNVLAHNLHAQAFMDDAAALDRMAELCSQMFDTAKKNEAKYGSRENGVKNSSRDMKLVDTTGVDPATEDESLSLNILDSRNLSRYYRDVTDILNNNMLSNRLLLIGKPPKIIEKYMGSSNPLYMPQTIVRKVVFDKNNGGKHGLGRVVIDDLPYQFTKPLAITGNTKQHQDLGDNSIVVWTDWKTKAGDAIIVPIRIDVEGQVGFFNNVNSVFDVYDQNYFNDLLRDGNVLYTENNRDIHDLLNAQGREVPESQATNVSMDRIAHKKKKINTSVPKKSTEKDTAYLSAVKRRDMKTAQQMVDEAAERAFKNSKVRDEDGKLIKVYHGTEESFTVFDKTKGRANMDIQGMFFSPWEIDAQGYGSKVQAYYLNITNPASEGVGFKALNSHKGENYAGIRAREDLVRMGYDGVNNSDEEYIAFNSEQIKSADPVTYDDNGDVIPLSKRFDQNNPDIRYSKDDTIYDLDDEALPYLEDEEDDMLFTPDGDISFEGMGKAKDRKIIDVERLMSEQKADFAVYTLYNSLSQTAERAIKGYNGFKLEHRHYEKIAKRVMRAFSIKENEAPGLSEVIAERIEEYVQSVVKGKKADFSTFINGLATDCRGYLEYSGDYTRGGLPGDAEAFRSMLQGKTLIITPYAESEVLDRYDGDLKALRRMFRGYVNIGLEKDKGKYKNPVYIDDIIDAWADRTGDAMDGIGAYFPDGERPDSLSGWSWLADMIDIFQPKFVKRFGENTPTWYESIDAVAMEMAFDINTEIVNEKAKVAAQSRGADRKQMQQLREESRKALTEQKALNRAKQEQSAQALNRMRAKYQREANLRSLAEEDLAVMKSFVASDTKNYRQQYMEREQTKKDLEAIRRNIAKLRTMIVNPTNEKFIPPEILHNTTFLNAVEALGEGIILNRRSQVAEKMGVMLRQIRALKTDSQKFDGDFEYAFDDGFTEMLQGVVDNLTMDYEQENPDGTKKITRDSFDRFEIDNLRQLVDEIIYRIENARKLLLREDGKTAREASDAVIRETRALDINKTKKIFSGVERMFTNPLRAVNFMSGFNEKSELRRLVYDLNEGQRKQWFWEMNAEKMFTDLVKKHEKEYQRACNDIVHFDYTENGKGYHLDMTRMQALQILMTWKRESRSSMNHLRRGGVTVADPRALIKGKGDIWEKQQRAPVGYDLINQIIKTLGKFENEYMLTAEKYFNQTAKDAINETFMVTRHREIARSEYYIPVRVDKDFSKAESEGIEYDFRMESAGSYQHITPNAPQPILIESLNTVIDRHIKQTGRLYGLDIPIINFRRMFKGTTSMPKEGVWFEADSVKKALTDKFGARSVTYLEDTVNELEKGGRKDTDSDQFSKIADWLYRTRIRTSLVGNLGVVIKQAASYPTAGLYLSAGDLSAGLAKFTGKGLTRKYQSIIDEIDAHTAQHYIRRKGMSVQEVSDMFTQSKLARKTPTPLNPIKWIQGMDCLTTAALWEATKSNINRNYKKNGKEIGSKQYWQDVTDLYDTIIEDTQPMYDALHRSEFQKSKSRLRKFLFPFKTQPMQNMGILADSAARLVMKGDKASAKQFAKAVSSQVTSNLVFSVMTFVAALSRHRDDRYKDENDEFTFGSITSGVLWDMFTNGINTVMPIGGDYVESAVEDVVTQIQKGGSPWDNFKKTKETTEISVVNDWFDKFSKAAKLLENQLNGTNKAEVNPWDMVWRVLDVPGSFAEFFGIPYSNLSTIFKGVGNRVKDTQMYGLVNNKGELKVDHITTHIINAYNSGNQKKGDELTRMWINQKMSEGYTGDKAQSFVNDKMIDGIATMEETKQAAIASAGGNMAEAERLIQGLAGKGLNETLVNKAIDKVIANVKKALKDSGVTDREEAVDELTAYGFNESAANDIAKSYMKSQEDASTGEQAKYNLTDAFTAKKNGEAESYALVRDHLAEQYVEKGTYSTKEKAAEYVDKQMTSATHTKSLFKELEDATDNGPRKRLDRINRELVNVFGSRETAMKAYREYKKNKDKKK